MLSSCELVFINNKVVRDEDRCIQVNVVNNCTIDTIEVLAKCIYKFSPVAIVVRIRAYYIDMVGSMTLNKVSRQQC